MESATSLLAIDAAASNSFYIAALGRLRTVYEESSGDRTKELYAELEALGPAGIVAVNVFRATKTSARAKVYRGGNGKGRYKAQAYATKDWSLANLCGTLVEHGANLGIHWGWAKDPAQEFHDHVLYVELPTGQVSFHNGGRHAGPDYAGAWDGVRGVGPPRIQRWCAQLLAPPGPFDITDGRNEYQPCPHCGSTLGCGLMSISYPPNHVRVAVECSACQFRGPEVVQTWGPYMLSDRNAFDAWNELPRKQPPEAEQPSLGIV